MSLSAPKPVSQSATELRLVLNSSARISIEGDQELIFLVEAPIRGLSFSSFRVCAQELPGAHAFLRSVLIDRCQDPQIDALAADDLRRIGLFAPADELPQAVSYAFPHSTHSGGLCTCAEVDAMGGAASVVQSALQLPADWPAGELRFVAHHHGSVWAPVRVDGAVATEFADDGNAMPGVGQPSSSLDSESTRKHFENEGFANLDQLLPAAHVRELARYFQALAAEGFLVCYSDQGTHRFGAHNHAVPRFWHNQLNERVSQLVGRRTKPSYSFLSHYVAGGSLPWHTDRPPCEYTITVLLDYAPLDGDQRSPWALKIAGRDGTVHALHQRLGDALIFKGRELRHGRDLLPEGHRSTSLMFHFVNQDYDGVME